MNDVWRAADCLKLLSYIMSNNGEIKKHDGEYIPATKGAYFKYGLFRQPVKYEKNFRKYMLLTLFGHLLRNGTVFCWLVVIGKYSSRILVAMVLLLYGITAKGRSGSRKYAFVLNTEWTWPKCVLDETLRGVCLCLSTGD